MALMNGSPREMRLLTTVATTLLLSASGRLWAGSPTPDFQFDPVEHWAARIFTWVLTIGVILVGYALLQVMRGRLVGVKGKMHLLVGVVLLPLFSITTGMLLVFTKAERVDFCSSCHHVMQAYADDMTNPSGEGLAAIHFVNRYIPNNQCYECHTSYGLFGTVEAKMHGIGEVFRYYTGTYELPVEMWKPYSNSDCLKCHAQSNRWLSVEAHTDGDSEVELFEDQVSCMTCHDSAHQVRDSAGLEGS